MDGARTNCIYYGPTKIIKDKNFYKETIEKCAGMCQSKKKHWHCRLCRSSFLDIYRFKRHFQQSHYLQSVTWASYTCLPCKIDHERGQTQTRPHFHCPVCQIHVTKYRFKTHLQSKHTEGETNTCHETKNIDNQIDQNSIERIPVEHQNQISQTQYAECPICSKNMKRRSIPQHCRDAHNVEIEDVAYTVDQQRGIYLVRKSSHGGIPFPVHVCKNYSERKIICEDTECMDTMRVFWGSDFPSTECRHLKAVSGTIVTLEDIKLKESSLEKISPTGIHRMLKEKKIDDCLDMAKKAKGAPAPLLQVVDRGRYMVFSVYSPAEHFYCRIGRVVVMVDLQLGQINCRCCNAKVTCIHKGICFWYLAQKDLIAQFREKSAADDGEEAFEESEEYQQSNLVYPPTDVKIIKRMCQYIATKKRIPQSQKDDLILSDIPSSLVPVETKCEKCKVELSEPHLITRKAKVWTMAKVHENIETYYKPCPQCGMCYRYQESNMGLHNFNDKLLVSIELCKFVKDALQEFIPIGSIAKILSHRLKQNVHQQTLIEAYLHFDALYSGHCYSFNCDLCGYFPTILIMDLCRKINFRCPASYLSPVNVDEADEVNCEDFWNKVECGMLLRGFPGISIPEWKVRPNLSDWAPYIGEKSRRGLMIYNTEHKKVSKTTGVLESECRQMSEERLIEALHNLSSKEFDKLAKSVIGKSPKGSKFDKLFAIRDAIGKSEKNFMKAFRKLWGSSGGWVSALCPHGIIYAAKFVLRAESPRDFVDILLSFRYMPNITIVDMANMVVAHGDKRQRGMFSPHSGMVCEETEENLARADAKTLSVSMPWILRRNFNSNIHSNAQVHPVSGEDARLCLFDRLHERNVTEKAEILRRVYHITELKNNINTQVVEQFHSLFKRADRFLNQMKPNNHIFLFRSIMDYRNQELNRKIRNNITKTNSKVKVIYDTNGQIFVTNNWTESPLMNVGECEDSAGTGIKDEVVADDVPVNKNITEEMLIDDEVVEDDVSVNNNITDKLINTEKISIDDEVVEDVSVNNNITDKLINTEKISIDDEVVEDVSVNKNITDKLINTEKSSIDDEVVEDDVSVNQSIAESMINEGSDIASNQQSWVKNLNLEMVDKAILQSHNEWFNDRHINAAMKLMKLKYPDIGGLQDVVVATAKGYDNAFGRFVQIVNLRETHWVVISNRFAYDRKTILYDSMISLARKDNGKYSYPDDLDCAAFQLSGGEYIDSLQVADIQQQGGGNDCGVFAVANAIALCEGKCPDYIIYEQGTMRRALMIALENGDISLFWEHANWSLTDRSPCPKTLITSWQYRRPIFCTCKQRDYGSLMVECTRCKLWYHAQCEIGPFKEDRRWKCRKCIGELLPPGKILSPQIRKLFKEYEAICALLEESPQSAKIFELYTAVNDILSGHFDIRLPCRKEDVGCARLEKYYTISRCNSKKKLMGVTLCHLYGDLGKMVIIIFPEYCPDQSYLLSTMLHEMAHAFQRVTYDNPGPTHGTKFKKVAKEIIKHVEASRRLLPKPFRRIQIKKSTVLTAYH